MYSHKRRSRNAKEKERRISDVQEAPDVETPTLFPNRGVAECLPRHVLALDSVATSELA